MQIPLDSDVPDFPASSPSEPSTNDFRTEQEIVEHLFSFPFCQGPALHSNRNLYHLITYARARAHPGPKRTQQRAYQAYQNALFAASSKTEYLSLKALEKRYKHLQLRSNVDFVGFDDGENQTTI